MENSPAGVRAAQALATHAVGLRDALALMFDRGEDPIHARTSAAPCTFSTWIDGKTSRVRRYGGGTKNGLRFAFYGRVSTTDYQDPASSRRWQLDVATELIAGHGRVVAEYFDVGCTRERPWAKRPRAAALLAAIADSDRVFDAIVVGEYARAFSGSQLLHLAVLLQKHGVQLRW